MAFDVFALRDRVVDEYQRYVESFINILDPEIDAYVRAQLAGGHLWPDALLQLNPAYEPGPTLGELAGRGCITRETARFFGPGLQLYRHQQEALEIALRGESYLVSTGTGSGKSLTYLVPIVDHIIRNQPQRHSVRAIIVYPMNALINSQLEALEEFRRRNWADAPIRFARYTGQTKREEREQIVNDPPHILLTNYVMLEYMLIRPYERNLVATATRELSFLAVDELHVYRGRQGADVAMLLRRLRQRAGRNLQIVGTSATIASEGNRQERKAQIAEAGSKLFGVEIRPENIVDESLRRVTTVPAPQTQDELRRAVQAPPPQPTPAAVMAHPLAAWVEETFGLDTEDGRLVRRAPVAFRAGLDQLARASGLPEEECRRSLQAVLDVGSSVPAPSGEPLLAFRLHQFLSSGGSVFTTLEPGGSRLLTMEGRYAVSSPEGTRGKRLLFPLAFCRECGQEYHLVAWQESSDGSRFVPRSPLLYGAESDTEGTPGFFSIEQGELWEGQDEDLPESWFVARASGPRLKDEYARHRPQRCWVLPDGAVSRNETEGGLEGWFQPRPFMLCLRCRAVYDLRRRSDFPKLATLSQTGRSTATTVLANAAVTAMRTDPAVDETARKVLSFTDNRQDASLQAGHLNDFVRVVLLRGALARALQGDEILTFERLGRAIFAALDPSPDQFMKEAVEAGAGYNRARDAMIGLLEYRAFEDLRRAWRVAQPNLEQCGLLRIEYDGLAELAADDARWAGVPGMGEAPLERRAQVLQAFLDHLRGQLAIDARCLIWDEAQQLRTRTQYLSEGWAMDEREPLRQSAVALLPGVERDQREARPVFSLGWRSSVGRYLRSRHTWGRTEGLSAAEGDELARVIAKVLTGHILTAVRSANGGEYGVQIMASALRWVRGDGTAPGPDPVRARSLYMRRPDLCQTQPNAFFSDLYQNRALGLVGIIGHEHTGQVEANTRAEREDQFRAGLLPALFCSPTMELGVDIRDLAVVHMRNVPPTPANYAQRSGRAGRGGRAALVVAFCSQGNGHDQYFFRRRGEMVAGAVPPARMDLTNRELIEAHLHSLWLANTGVSLGSSMAEFLDLEATGCPILPEKAAPLQLSEARQQEVIHAFRQVLARGALAAQSEWLTGEWIRQKVRSAPESLDRAFDRWRDLYQAALRQRDAARRRIDQPRVSRAERSEAEQQEQEAKREIDLLLNNTGGREESDFYPYRYLATEGFLPGYNFPRLPLRALVTARNEAQSIDRPRFLGLAEFGPRNVIYHEGRKHRVTSCLVPASGLQARLSKAKICLVCGYIHPEDSAQADECQYCRTRLDGATSLFPQALLDQPVVRASVGARITADEEERVREGYRVTTHFHFTLDTRQRTFEARLGDGPLLEITYAPQAVLWRINHGWRRSARQEGFTLDLENGRWSKRPDDDDTEDDTPDLQARQPLHGVKPCVVDTRNILLLRPPGHGRGPEFLLTLAYALQRGMQVLYQVEEHEIAVELLGQGEHQRLLLWEAAEGGTGVWERLLSDQHGFAQVALRALEICHFDPATGSDRETWAADCPLACYSCLLSYSNQPDHRYIDRYLVRDYLLQLAQSETVSGSAGRDYDEQYRWLVERIDPASSLEREFLENLYRRRLRLPHLAQHQPVADLNVQADFYYRRNDLPGICVFTDGPAHDGAHQAEHDRQIREALEDRGYQVVAIRYDRAIDETIEQYRDVFQADGD